MANELFSAFGGAERSRNSSLRSYLNVGYIHSIFVVELPQNDEHKASWSTHFSSSLHHCSRRPKLPGHTPYNRLNASQSVTVGDATKHA